MNKRPIKKTLGIFLPIIIFILCGAAVFGAVVLFSSHVWGGGEMSAATLGTEAEVEFSATTSSADVTFTEGGEKADFILSVKNSTASHLSFLYKITHNASSDLASAILVHYDGEFLGTLGELCSIGDGNVGSAPLGQGFVSSGLTDASHTLTLELHEATPSSYYDGKSLTVTVEAYTQTVDYEKYIFVTSEEEFLRAADDINSGMLDHPTIVLGAPVTLTADYNLSNSCSIDLNGNVLELGGKNLTVDGSGVYRLVSSAPMTSSPLGNGSIILNNEESLLDIESFYNAQTDVGALYGSLVTLTSYDTEAATVLLLDTLSVGTVFAGTTANVFGANGFYSRDITASSEIGTFTNGILSLPESKTTEVSTVTVGTSSFELKIIGSDDAAFEEIKNTALAHLPLDENEKITSDIFLPTSVPSKNATIIWHSNNEQTVSSLGIINDVVRDNEPVTLFAEIRVNDAVQTVAYSFHVSSQNNETKFSYLIAQLSPITLDNVYSVDPETSLDNAVLAHHYLPTVNQSGSHDYRTNFSTPSARANPFLWMAYKDIGLESIEYSVSTLYNYVSCDIDGSGDAYAYLNTSVFYDYAQINVTGRFKNGEEYTGVVNVIISLGDDSDLQNKVFRYIDGLLSEINVLENILSTRRDEGMLHERGDFYLPPKYMTYAISYSIPESSKNVIRQIVSPGATYTDNNGEEKVNESDMYLIRLNPEHFYSSETAIGINITIKLESADTGSETRILYFNAPAVIKPDESGFENLGVFNSIKYQIYQQLADDERDGESGFTVSGSTLTANTGAYILRRDAEFATKITLQIKGDTSATDNSAVYTLMRLLEWATGNTAGVSADSVWSSGGSTVSDGQEFLTDPEITVIKNYWRSATGSDISDSLWNTAFHKAIGRVITNGDVLNEKIKAIGLDAGTYYKYVEMLNWSLDKQDYGKPAGGQWDGSPPNLGTLLRQYTFTGNGGYTLDATASSYTRSKYYTNSMYQEDQSTYISEAEAELLRALILNLSVSAGRESAGAEYVAAFDQNVVIPTYLNAGGVGLLAHEFYAALGITTHGFVSEVASLNGYVIPTVAGLDDSLNAMRYLTGLTELYIYGEEPSGTDKGLAAFLTTSALSGFFNQITANNQSFTKLEMVLVARNYVSFDITFTERLINLTHLNYSHNSGITTIGPLVNLPMANIKYLNVAGVDVTFEFSEYVLSNIYAAGGNSAEIWYTDSVDGAQKRYGGGAAVDESLTYLNEANKLQSEYLQLIPSLSTGSGAKDIFWRIESGNMIQFVTVAGELIAIESVENYYYCTATFGSFVAGHIYAFRRNGASYFTDLGAYTVVNGIPDSVEFTDAEKNNTTSGNHDTETPGASNTTYNQNSTQNVANNNRVNNAPNRNLTLTITYGNGQTATVNNVRSLVYSQKIQKTVTTQITVERISGRQATKTVTYYDDSTDQVVEATYVYISGDRYTQTYQLTVNYWYCNFYYTTGNFWNTTTTYLYNTNYAEWTTLNYNGTTYQRTSYADTESSRTSGFNENNFRLAAQGIEDVTLSSTETLISPIGTINGQAKVDALTAIMENAVRGGVLYIYRGTTSTVDYYNNSTSRYKSATFTANAIYAPSVDNQGFITWTENSSINGENVGAGGMDAILREANLHVNDQLYGMYYGMYYGYYGSSFVTADGNTYVSGYVYRLLIGDDGKFYFEHDDTSKMGIPKNTFTVIGQINGTNGLLDRARLATTANVGDLYYYLPTGNDHYYHQPNRFYIITRSETGDYFGKLFGAIDSVFEENADGTYTLRLENTRIYEEGGELYGGTGGTEYVVVTAVIKTDGGESLRKFKIKVTG